MKFPGVVECLNGVGQALTFAQSGDHAFGAAFEFAIHRAVGSATHGIGFGHMRVEQEREHGGEIALHTTAFPRSSERKPIHG